jgi:DNA-binding transcriptional ArsR family regulator
MEAFDVLGDPVRRRILELLAGGELASGAIGATVQAEFGISQPAVSQHLRVLREAGLLSERRDGTRRLYALRPEAIEPVRSFLDDLWPSSLARLKAAVEADRPGSTRRQA